MKVRVIAIAAWAFSALLPTVASASTTYSTNLSQIGANLYEGWAGDYIIATVSCSAFVTSAPSTLRIDTNSGYVIGQVTFPTGATCDVVGVYGYLPSISVGSFAATLTKLVDGIYTEQASRLFVRTRNCYWNASFLSSTVNVFVNGRGYQGGVPIGTASLGSSLCDVIGLYGWVNSAGVELSISKTGIGSGTVTSSPAGISCGSACVSGFTSGATVTLTATANIGSIFQGWTGACSGAGTCVVTMDAAKGAAANFAVASGTALMMNISTRGMVLTGDNVMIGGFVIQGDSPKTVLVTARGPSLTAFGVSGALANPQVSLVDQSTHALIASNDDWGTAVNAASISATGLAPTNPLESAILVTLNPGAYTAVVSGVGGSTGVGIVEVFAQ